MKGSDKIPKTSLPSAIHCDKERTPYRVLSFVCPVVVDLRGVEPLSEK
jgi:hypothetical protein